MIPVYKGDSSPIHCLKIIIPYWSGATHDHHGLGLLYAQGLFTHVMIALYYMKALSRCGYCDHNEDG